MTSNRWFLSSLVHWYLAVSEEKTFLNSAIKKKNCLWQPCLLFDRFELRNFIKHLPQMLPVTFDSNWSFGFRREDFFNHPNRNKNCLWQQCLKSYQDKTKELCKGTSIDAPCQVWFQLRFQRRR